MAGRDGDENIDIIGNPVEIPFVANHVVDSDAHRARDSCSSGAWELLEDALDPLTEDSSETSLVGPAS